MAFFPIKDVTVIDVGHGYTKRMAFTDNGLVVGRTPSMAPIASMASELSDFSKDRRTRRVRINSVTYEVGPDVGDIADSSKDRIRSDTFAVSDPYVALVYEALAEIGRKRIPVLVLGLPLDALRHGQHLRDVFTGEHSIGEGDTAISVYIERVEVMPQPMGGWEFSLWADPEVSFASDNDERLEIMAELREGKTLVLDVGDRSFDSLMMKNARPVESRSDAFTGGVSRVLDGMCNSISEQELGGRPYTDHDALERAIRKRSTSLRVRGKRIDLKVHKRAAASIIESSIHQAKALIKDIDDVERLVLIGGGAPIFLDKVRKHMNVENVLEFGELTQYANVIGYFLSQISPQDRLKLNWQELLSAVRAFEQEVMGIDPPASASEPPAAEAAPPAPEDEGEEASANG